MGQNNGQLKFTGCCYQLNFVSQNPYAESLTPAASECSCIWRQCHPSGESVEMRTLGLTLIHLIGVLIRENWDTTETLGT